MRRVFKRPATAAAAFADTGGTTRIRVSGARAIRDGDAAASAAHPGARSTAAVTGPQGAMPRPVDDRLPAMPAREDRRVPGLRRTREQLTVDAAPTTRHGTAAPTFAIVEEAVLLRSESVRYEPIELALKRTGEPSTRGGADARSPAAAPATVQARVLVHEAGRWRVEVPERGETNAPCGMQGPVIVREVELPAVYAVVTRRSTGRESGAARADAAIADRPTPAWAIDVDTLRAWGYRITDGGDLVATPSGERVLRAVALAAGGGCGDLPGTAPREVTFVREVRVPAQYATIRRQVVLRPAPARETGTGAVSGAPEPPPGPLTSLRSGRPPAAKGGPGLAVPPRQPFLQPQQEDPCI